jgi:hypothetical protein
MTVFRRVRYGLASAIIAAPIAAQQDPPKPAVRVEAIPAIIDAFRSTAIVALGDAHGNQQAQTFFRSLVRDPRQAALEVLGKIAWPLERNGHTDRRPA